MFLSNLVARRAESKKRRWRCGKKGVLGFLWTSESIVSNIKSVTFAKLIIEKKKVMSAQSKSTVTKITKTIIATTPKNSFVTMNYSDCELSDDNTQPHP